MKPIGAAFAFAALVLSVFAGDDFAQFVDPFVGTAGTGHTFPGACVPFGLVQASPDTGTDDWDHCSGYRHEDKAIYGFSQTHLNGTGGEDLGDVLLVPFAGNCGETGKNVGPFEKAGEFAEPGYYRVLFPETGISAEATASEHVGFYRFSSANPVRLMIDCQWGIVHKGDIEWHVLSHKGAQDGATGFSGELRTLSWNEREVFFHISFNRKIAGVAKLRRRSQRERGDRYVVDFEPGAGPLLVKVALAADGGVAEAKRNLEAEIPRWDFDAVKAAARAKWNEVFARAVVEGDENQKRNWYTSLYHLFIQPNNLANAGETPFYSTLSTWDTFRAAHPLYTILAPEKAAEFVDSMLEQGRRTGYLPVWTLWGKDNQCMIGTHSIPVIVDWFLKEGNGEPGSGNGLDFSHKEHKDHKDDSTCSTCSTWLNNPVKREYWLSAYAQIKDTLTKRHDDRIKERWDLLDRYGYYPFDEITGESVSRTMECAYDDWCAGVMAAKLGFAADAAFFFKRAKNWRNVFDPSIGLVRGKDSKGNWREPYNPYEIGHGADLANDFTEGNAFQYTWHVLHDPHGLIEAMGGREAFADRLDSLFAQPETVDGMGCLVDVTGLVGQYVHGNEPSHHVIYFYPLAGRPEKAAERIREVFDKFYLPKPDGLCGNDDCGQMSAWYLFSAMGFYPFNPCGGEYILGAPQVACAKLKVESGEFRVAAHNLSRENKYVKSVTLNGQPVTDWKIRHSDIMRGGELVFEMASTPE